MNSDCFFTGTRKHHICQDYALCNTQPFPYIMIGDGCSSSINTDVGVRVLLQKFKYEIENARLCDIDISNFEHCLDIVQNMNLNKDSLDCTFLMSRIKDGIAEIETYGDGNIIIIHNDGKVFYKKLSYDNNAPFYLSYYFDQDRHFEYVKSLNDTRNIKKIYYSHTKTEEKFDYDFQYTDEFYIKDIKYIVLASDGLSSFYDKNTGENISVDKIINDIIDFKNNTGEFVKRRMYRLMKDYEKDGILNYDDVSVAAIYCGE